MKSFRSRVLWLLLALVALVQAATVIAFVLQTNRRAEQQAREDLQVGAHVLDALLQSRAEQLREAVQVLVADYGFKEAATLSDAETLVSALDNSAERVDAQIAVLLDMRGQVLAATVPRLAKYTPTALSKLAQNDIAEAPVVSYLAINDTPYLLVSTPVRAPTPVAIAVLGFAVDAALADQMSGLLKYQVGFVAGSIDNPRIIGSLPDWVLNDLSRQLRSQSLVEPQILSIGDDDYMTLLAPVQGGGTDLKVMLQKPLLAALSPYRGSRLVILSVALIALVSAIPLARRLAAQISIPLEQLAGAARRIETGDYTERIALDAPHEFAAVANTLDSMQRNIAEREQRIRHQATHDELTGLPNRRLATERLHAALAEATPHNRPVALLILEIVEFDRVRASFGFAVGDAVLCETARRLTGLAGGNATIARIAVAQFLVIAPAAELEMAENKARQLLFAVRSGFVHDGLTISLDARVGISLFPAHGVNEVELQRRADTALFEAKEQGAPIMVYEPNRDEKRRRQLELLGDLRRALQAEELTLHFQPKVDMRSHAVHGVEALVRWNHPRLGCVPPDEFVPLAESTGNIGVLTRWVIKTALEQMREWRTMGLDLDVAVNLSAIDLADPELANWVLEQLRVHAVSAARLVLEVTEGAVMRETNPAVATMERLRQHGIRFAVDDFGTGFSSLAQFKQLPVDEIKIDKSFVLQLQADGDDAAIVRATIDLGHNLGVRVVAEGVETPAAWRMLRECGCDLAQGYLISKPLPAAQVFEAIRVINANLATAESPTEQVRALEIAAHRDVAWYGR